jgi:predicted GH43/DUF377 family glycosyl hydrolase
MTLIKKEGVVLRPTQNVFEKRSVLNPAIYQDGNNVHIIYRAIADDYMSCLGYARLNGALEVVERWDKPFLYPTKKEESKGIEDPRIVKIGNEFFMTYVVHDGKHAISAYSTGTDLFDMKRGGIISPKIYYKDLARIFSYAKLKDEYYLFEAFYKQFAGNGVYVWHKDLVLFPEMINGQFFLLERVLPDMQLVEVENLDMLKDKYFWLHHFFNFNQHILLESEHGWESRHIGAGAPPVRTRLGWLVIYHSCQEQNKGRIYHAGAVVLDINNPKKVLFRLPYPLFSPDMDYELAGTVNNVVFPSGTAQFDGRLYIYYGAADNLIAVASANLEELLSELEKHPV